MTSPSPLTLRQKAMVSLPLMMMTLLCLCGTLAAGLYLSSRQRDSEKSVTHTYEVLDRIGRMEVATRATFQYHRDFFITHHPSYVRTGADWYREASEEYRALRTLTTDNIHEQRRLDDMHPVLEWRLDPHLTTVQMVEATSRQFALLHIVCDSLRMEELRLLRRRLLDMETVAGFSQLTMVLGTALGLLLVVGGFLELRLLQRLLSESDAVVAQLASLKNQFMSESARGRV